MQMELLQNQSLKTELQMETQIVAKNRAKTTITTSNGSNWGIQKNPVKIWKWKNHRIFGIIDVVEYGFQASHLRDFKFKLCHSFVDHGLKGIDFLFVFGLLLISSFGVCYPYYLVCSLCSTARVQYLYRSIVKPCANKHRWQSSIMLSITFTAL